MKNLHMGQLPKLIHPKTKQNSVLFPRFLFFLSCPGPGDFCLALVQEIFVLPWSRSAQRLPISVKSNFGYNHPPLPLPSSFLRPMKFKRNSQSSEDAKKIHYWNIPWKNTLWKNTLGLLENMTSSRDAASQMLTH